MHALIARIASALRGVASFSRRRSARAGRTLSGFAAWLGASVTAVPSRVRTGLSGFAGRSRRYAASTIHPRTLALGLGTVAAILVVLAVVRDLERIRDHPPLAVPAGEDLESEIALLGPPADRNILEPAPVPAPVSPVATADPSDESYTPDDDPVDMASGIVEPSPYLSPSELALLPERPRVKPWRGRPQWLANAVEPDLRGGGPLIAIVIDDVGIAQQRTARAIDLPAPVTLAFIPYGSNLEYHARRARDRGHELIVHIPMEPGSAAVDPGPNALLTGLDEEEIMRRFLWGLSQFDGYVGVSNHMGSRFMARGDLLAPLLAVTQEKGLLFLDSRTTADTAGSDIADRLRLPNARRDVFLDNEITVENVTVQLAETERIAREQGYAVAIGHPHDVTVQVLAEWIPEVRARGFTLVPISTIVRLDYGADYEAELAAAVSAGGETEGLLGGAQ